MSSYSPQVKPASPITPHGTPRSPRRGHGETRKARGSEVLVAEGCAVFAPRRDDINLRCEARDHALRAPGTERLRSSSCPCLLCFLQGAFALVRASFRLTRAFCRRAIYVFGERFVLQVYLSTILFHSRNAFPLVRGPRGHTAGFTARRVQKVECDGLRSTPTSSRAD